MQPKRDNNNFRIKTSSIFLVSQIYELKPCLAISLEIATHFGQKFSIANANLK